MQSIANGLIQMLTDKHSRSYLKFCSSCAWVHQLNLTFPVIVILDMVIAAKMAILPSSQKENERGRKKKVLLNRCNGVLRFSACKLLEATNLFMEVAYATRVRQPPTSCQEPLQQWAVSPTLPQESNTRVQSEVAQVPEEENERMQAKEPQPKSP